jgi:heat-inducible transcriptional repressor
MLLMLILDSGRVQQLTVECETDIAEDLIHQLRGHLNGLLVGSQLAEVESKLANLPEQFAPDRREFVSSVVGSLQALVDANRQEKLVLSGAANLVRRDADFNGELSQLLEAIEEQVVMLKLIDELHADSHGVGIRIGSELGLGSLASASLMMSGYESHGTEVAKLGVLGPTRMDYSAGISAVRAVARYVSTTFEGGK